VFLFSFPLFLRTFGLNMSLFATSVTRRCTLAK
jgi:hypothetical protein